jgi:hypothetical protein
MSMAGMICMAAALLREWELLDAWGGT